MVRPASSRMASSNSNAPIGWGSVPTNTVRLPSVSSSPNGSHPVVAFGGADPLRRADRYLVPVDLASYAGARYLLDAGRQAERSFTVQGRPHDRGRQDVVGHLVERRRQPKDLRRRRLRRRGDIGECRPADREGSGLVEEQHAASGEPLERHASFHDHAAAGATRQARHQRNGIHASAAIAMVTPRNKPAWRSASRTNAALDASAVLTSLTTLAKVLSSTVAVVRKSNGPPAFTVPLPFGPRKPVSRPGRAPTVHASRAATGPKRLQAASNSSVAHLQFQHDDVSHPPVEHNVPSAVVPLATPRSPSRGTPQC
jgi:hypothetical protein